jgi:hypothetical protein
MLALPRPLHCHSKLLPVPHWEPSSQHTHPHTAPAHPDVSCTLQAKAEYRQWNSRDRAGCCRSAKAAPQLSSEEVEAALDVLDLDKSGGIDFGEFVAFWVRKVQQPEAQQELEQQTTAQS